MYCTNGIKLVLLILAFGFIGLKDLSELQAASTDVIETFEAGPEKVKRKVSGVKTNFSWTKPNSCDCPQGEGPCIQSFLDKRASKTADRYPSRIEDYYIQNQMGDPYQGAGQVPWGIDVSSVRLLNIPFCRQVKTSNN